MFGVRLMSFRNHRTVPYITRKPRFTHPNINEQKYDSWTDLNHGLIIQIGK